MTNLDILAPPRDLEGMSRRDRKKQETRWRIYDSGIELMSEYGFDEVTIGEICESADVSTPLFFHHFSSKGALIAAYLENLKAAITEKLTKDSKATSTQQLLIIHKEVIRASKEAASFTPQLFNAIVSGEQTLGLDKLNIGLTNALADIVRQGQAAGEFHKAWRPEVAAASIAGAWVCLPLAASSNAFPKKAHEELLTLILAGLRCPPDGV